MSDRPIQVGDLVVIVRTCCEAMALGGVQYGVPATFLGMNRQETQCWFCGAKPDPASMAKLSDGWSPLPWLKRIPPLDELESVQTDKKLKESV